MILKTSHIIGGGAYADIFRDPDHSIVYKLFVSGAHPTNALQWLNRREDEERRRNTFQSQCKAYEIASQHLLQRDSGRPGNVQSASRLNGVPLRIGDDADEIVLHYHLDVAGQARDRRSSPAS